MDYQKKKLLTQSVSFIQGNLTVNADLLNAMKAASIFTQEEISTIHVSTPSIYPIKNLMFKFNLGGGQPSQSLILGPVHNHLFGVTDAPILDFGHLDC